MQLFYILQHITVCYLQQIQQNLKQIQRKLVVLYCKQQIYFYVVILDFAVNRVYYLQHMQSPVAARGVPWFFLLQTGNIYLIQSCGREVGGLIVALDSTTNKDAKTFSKAASSFLQPRGTLKMFLKKFLVSVHQCSIRVPTPCIQIKRFSLSDIDYFKIWCCCIFICLDLSHRILFFFQTVTK